MTIAFVTCTLYHTMSQCWTPQTAHRNVRRCDERHALKDYKFAIISAHSFLHFIKHWVALRCIIISTLLPINNGMLSTCHIVYPANNVWSSYLGLCWSCSEVHSVCRPKQGKSEHQRLSRRFTDQFNRKYSLLYCYARACVFSYSQWCFQMGKLTVAPYLALLSLYLALS